MKNILEDVKTIVSRHLKLIDKTVTEDMKLKSDLEFDSVHFVPFVIEIEEFFDIEFNDEFLILVNDKTIKEFADYIINKKSKL